MGDYAGAMLAVKDRLTALWTTTPVAFINEPAGSHLDVDGFPAAWVFCEILGTGSELTAAGQPGYQVWTDYGLIAMHVFVPAGSGTALAYQHAVALGEIFRSAAFYQDQDNIVRTTSPRISGADSGSDDGMWMRVTCTVPFEYWRRK